MSTVFLVFLVVAAAAFASFGAGYALGYNVAKHPDKVKAQADAAVADIKAKL